MNRPGPPTPQHRSSTETPGAIRLNRQRPDLARAHEALLLDEFAGGVRGHACSTERLDERSAIVLLHAEQDAIQRREGAARLASCLTWS